MLSDEELMSQAAQGDWTAFAQLVTRHQRSAWSAAFRLLGDAHEAEDVAQEAFLRILRAAPRYQPRAAFRTYLYRIVTRLCRDVRRRALPSSVQDFDARVSQWLSPEASAAARDECRAVQQALASLPVKQREAIVLRYYEGLTYDEISQVMRASPKAIERLLARGRTGLVQRLSGLVGG
jgi:RNA polymerase sigma-70 factor, ECF subfamily